VCRERVGCDYFLPLQDDELHDISALYEQVVVIRRALGLSFADMFPWAMWLARARRIFGDAYDMYWGVHDEVIAYLGPFADEAIERAKERLKKEPATPENAAAKTLAEGNRIMWRFKTELDGEDETFWEPVEKALAQRGPLRLEAAKARPGAR